MGPSPLIRPRPSLNRASPLIPLNSFIPLSPTLNSVSPSLYGYLAKQKAEQQAFVNRYQAEEKAERALELWFEKNLPHEPLVPKTLQKRLDHSKMDPRSESQGPPALPALKTDPPSLANPAIGGDQLPLIGINRPNWKPTTPISLRLLA